MNSRKIETLKRFYRKELAAIQIRFDEETDVTVKRRWKRRMDILLRSLGPSEWSKEVMKMMGILPQKRVGVLRNPFRKSHLVAQRPKQTQNVPAYHVLKPLPLISGDVEQNNRRRVKFVLDANRLRHLDGIAPSQTVIDVTNNKMFINPLSKVRKPTSNDRKNQVFDNPLVRRKRTAAQNNSVTWVRHLRPQQMSKNKSVSQGPQKQQWKWRFWRGTAPDKPNQRALKFSDKQAMLAQLHIKNMNAALNSKKTHNKEIISRSNNKNQSANVTQVQSSKQPNIGAAVSTVVNGNQSANGTRSSINNRNSKTVHNLVDGNASASVGIFTKVVQDNKSKRTKAQEKWADLQRNKDALKLNLKLRLMEFDKRKPLQSNQKELLTLYSAAIKAFGVDDKEVKELRKAYIQRGKNLRVINALQSQSPTSNSPKIKAIHAKGFWG